jgi:radical SAM superfamily enzyme YgiQ (UPF0313 family)
MKIVFITPASTLCRNFFYRLGNKIYGHSNSITGPLVLGHILKNAGHTVEVYEELFRDVDLEVCDSADVVCLYTMTSTAPRAYQLADTLRKRGKRIIIGGIHASALPEEALLHADIVITGEGESVIRDAVEENKSGQIIKAPPLRNLDDIPFPDYSILKTPCEVANVLTTRGCPFHCSFCTTSRMFNPYRERSVDNVIAELRYYKKLGFRYMNFEDDNFTADKERTKKILRIMIRENLTFKETFFFGRTDMADDEELLTLLEKAHLTRVLVGIESLNQKALDTINKHQKISDIEKCSEALQRHHIRLIASLVLGIDTDGPADIQRSVDFCKKINAYQLQPAILTPYPGTPVYEQYAKEGRIINADWQFYNMIVVNFKPKRMNPWMLQKCFFRALRKFYTLVSSFKITKIFGFEYGVRRFLFGLLIKFALAGVFLLTKINLGNPLYRLSHMQAADWHKQLCTNK